MRPVRTRRGGRSSASGSSSWVTGAQIVAARSLLLPAAIPLSCHTEEAILLGSCGRSTTLAELAGPLVEIQGGTKKKHFAKLKEKTGIAYSDMLFFVRG